MKKTLYILIPVLVCFLVGYIARLVQADSIGTWYLLLDKSPLTPPNIAFSIAWSILYLFMGISIGLVWATGNEKKTYLTELFIVQLFFNFLWSISFFYLQNPLLGLVNILILEGLIIFYAVKAYPIVKISSLLFIPYIAWVGFATYLNAYILINN